MLHGVGLATQVAVHYTYCTILIFTTLPTFDEDLLPGYFNIFRYKPIYRNGSIFELRLSTIVQRHIWQMEVV